MPRNILFGIVISAILLTGLVVSVYLTQKNQNPRTKASENSSQVQILSPHPQTKVLGVIQIRARANIKADPSEVKAVLQVDGVDTGTQITVSKLDENDLGLIGSFDSGQIQPGSYSLDLYLYDSEGSSLLGSDSVPINVVRP